jgi:hypothetical protein
MGVSRAALLICLALTPTAHAIRPFITDDARVVGRGLAQLETWAQLDAALLQQNLLVALGPTPWLEVTLGVQHGVALEGGRYGLAGPLAQAKALLFPPVDQGRPGVAIAAGLLAPVGFGALTPPSPGGFGFLIATASLLEERVLLHLNLGLTGLAHAGVSPTAGVGAQVRVVAGLHAVGEVVYGDPYAPLLRAPAGQLGFRYVFSDEVQLDGTVAAAVSRERLEPWGTLGLRLVTPAPWW